MSKDIKSRCKKVLNQYSKKVLIFEIKSKKLKQIEINNIYQRYKESGERLWKT